MWRDGGTDPRQCRGWGEDLRGKTWELKQGRNPLLEKSNCYLCNESSASASQLNFPIQEKHLSVDFKKLIVASWKHSLFGESCLYRYPHPSLSGSSSCCGRQLKWQMLLSIHHPDTRREVLLKLKDNVCIRAARPQINSCWKLGEGFHQSDEFLEGWGWRRGNPPSLRSWAGGFIIIKHNGEDFDLSETGSYNSAFLLCARGLWAARALPNDPCCMERNLKNICYWISIVFPILFAFKTSFQMLCVGQDTFLLNTHPIFPIVDSGWQHRLLQIQMELCENPVFSGPEKSCREIAAAVPGALAEPAHGRVSSVLLDYWETKWWNLRVSAISHQLCSNH